MTPSSGLKSAVNSLAVSPRFCMIFAYLQTRFSLPRESDAAVILINSIIEWAKDLCYTSCGNYLCQQLLERGDVEDKLIFIDKIKCVRRPIVPALALNAGTILLQLPAINLAHTSCARRSPWMNWRCVIAKLADDGARTKAHLRSPSPTLC